MKELYRKKNYTQGHLREQIKTKMKTEGLDCKTIQEQLGIGSSRTIYKWANSESIESKSSAPIKPYTMYSFNELIRLYCIRKYLELSIDNCIDELEEKYSIIIKRSSVGYYLKKRGLTKKEKRKTKKFKQYDPGYLHIDISYGPKLNGEKMYLYVAIDRATRLMYIEVHENKKADTAAHFLRNAIDYFPFKILKILTDNGKEFTLKNHLGKHDLEGAFDLVCNEFKIEHRLTKVCHPWTNGMVEKANDTIKTNTVSINEYKDKNEMKIDTQRFNIQYNLYRKHGSLVREKKGKAPFDALKYYYQIDPNIFKITPNQFKNKLEKYAKKNNIGLCKNISKYTVRSHWRGHQKPKPVASITLHTKLIM